MTYHVTFGDEDYRIFNEYTMFCTPQGKKTVLIYRLIVPFLTLFALAMIAIVDDDRAFQAVLAGIFAIFSVIWLLISKSLLKKSITKAINKQQKLGTLQFTKESDLSFDDGFITDTTPDKTLRYRLTKDLHTVQYLNYLYVYLSPVEAVVFRSSLLGDDRQAIIDLLKETTTFEAVEPK